MPQHSIKQRLINRSDSILLVIDVQDSFLTKLPQAIAVSVTERIGFLMDAAGVLDIPVICTAEEIPVLGGLTEKLLGRLPSTSIVFDKMVFNLADQPDIIAAVKSSGRSTAILTGLETDVCVAQSALGLISNGLSVVAVADACASPGDAHQAGLTRIDSAGGLITTVKSLYYEWIRTVEMSNQFSSGQYGWFKRPEGIVF